MTGTAIRDYLAPMLPVLIDAAIKAAALLLLAAAATAIMRKASAAGRQLVWFLAMVGLLVLPAGARSAVATPTTLLAPVVRELEREWPRNRTINIVCHGHSVPAGYLDRKSTRLNSSH